MWRAPLILLLCWSCRGATNTAATASLLDVSNALQACVAGDTVIIPPGSNLWTQSLSVRTPVAIIGSGTNSTIITNQSAGNVGTLYSYAQPGAFQFELTNGGSFRLSGLQIYNDPAGTRNNIIVHGKTPAKVVSFRIDHCYLRFADQSVLYCDGDGGTPFAGVLDNCTILNARYWINGYVQGAYWWTNALTGSPPYWGLGTTNCVVWENNYITWDQTWADNNNPVSSSYGFCYVIRHNFITNGFNGNFKQGFDAHGNYKCQPVPTDSDSSGTVFVEIYANKFWRMQPDLGGEGLAGMRGGTCLIYSNDVYTAAGMGVTTGDEADIALEEEETYDPIPGQKLPLPGTWPYWQQITNSFFWSNTLNGVLVYRAFEDAATSNACLAGGVGDAILLDRDFFNRPISGTDAIKNYLPLAFPHPLAQFQDGPLGPVFPPGTLNVSTLNVGTVKRP